MMDQADRTYDEAPRATWRGTAKAVDSGGNRTNGLRQFLRFAIRTLVVLLCGAAFIAALGTAQRVGWITAGGSSDERHASRGEENVRYICPMMCTPPQSEPGRCPVCAMELVRAASSSGASDPRSVEIDPVARRVANIHTVPVRAMSMTRTIRSIGEVSYDESTLRTISAYVDGRLDRLYADFTGVVVKRGDHLALFYSPQLYSAQIEFLLAKETLRKSQTSTRPGVIRSNREVYESARQRLVELGMTDPQVAELEATGKPNSRLHLCAPISGTVIEKFAVEGDYVNEGEPIYKLADFSTVWLMLEMFPEDAAAVHNGQCVVAEVQSLPGRKFEGRVAFVDPYVDRETKTVGVRAVVPNGEGLLRVGDYAKAIVHVNLNEQAARSTSLVVPRDAVLMAGGNSVVYVETAPGRFEIRPVVLGTSDGNQTVVLDGLAEGEQVATRGNFLIDSQMQLAGNPSLMDPTKAERAIARESSEMKSALAALATADRALARQQRDCPVTGYPLGSMGTPVKVQVNGRTVFICCEGCRAPLVNDPASYLTKVAGGNDSRATDNTNDGLPPIGAAQIVSPPIDHAPKQLHPKNVQESREHTASQGGTANRTAERPNGGRR